MRRKLAALLPNLYFIDRQLSVPGYIFEPATNWDDTGSQTLLAVGTDLKDGSDVLAKIAPANGSGAICLEREAHILDRLSGISEATTIALRVIDLMTLPKESGDSVILLLSHPGPNLLGHYFPPLVVNELLLARSIDTHASSDVYMVGEPEVQDELHVFGSMDLASFLEFAIQSAHCLEVIHKQGIVHREIRANAFHLNGPSGLVRFVHFGNRSISLEQLGGPSALVIAANALEDLSRLKVKEALCYLAPEQTGSIETSHEDHRTDLYSLGILFWTLLAGQGQMPFEGSPTEILHAIAQKRPMPVHEFRRDVPHVVAMIIERLLAKSPDSRYNSAYGLKADLLECQRRLLVAVSSPVSSEQTIELIPTFEIGLQDKYMNFTIPTILFGREKEQELLRTVIRQVVASYARQYGQSNSAQDELHPGDPLDDGSESPTSSISESPPSGYPMSVGRHNSDPSIKPSLSVRLGRREDQATPESLERRRSSRTSRRPSKTRGRIRTRSVVVTGTAGVGKSSLILAHQAKWRSHGLWGHAKFQRSAPAPFTALLSCLSSVLRQLMIFQMDVQRFVNTLKTRLGPLLLNAPLLYDGVPEFRTVLQLHGIDISTPKEALSTLELRIRFQSLVEQIFAVLAEIRLLALFLDDLHEADDSSLDLIQTLANSKSRMILLVSIRSEDVEKVDRIRTVFGTRSRRTTWISLDSLNSQAVLSLVSRTLHRTKEDCLSLSKVICRITTGNSFSVRNFLTSLHRHQQIVFDWQHNNWQYDLRQIEASLVADEHFAFPDQQAYLSSHWRELPAEAQRYLIWASFFGATFKTEEVASAIDSEDTSSGSGSSSDEDINREDSFQSMRLKAKEMRAMTTTRTSMKGLQEAIAEGWLVQRARDMCSFTHDRHYQTASAMADALPEGAVAGMSLRIITLLLNDERANDPYRVAEHAKRCLNLVIEKGQPIRDEVFKQLYEAGIAAWARGAHELALETLKNAYTLLAEDTWKRDAHRAITLLLKLAELCNWKGEVDSSNNYLEEAYNRVSSPEDKAQCLKIRSRNKFTVNDFLGGLKDTLNALEVLGITINLSPSEQETNSLFDEVRNEITEMGPDRILEISRSENPRAELIMQLLSTAGMNAYWRHGDGFADVATLSLTMIKVALKEGMCTGTATGFFWALGAIAEKRDLYDFAKTLGQLGLQLADKFGSNSDKCHALVLYCSMVSGYDDVHISANIQRCELALKYGLSSGDRFFSELSLIHRILNRLYCCEHLSELVLEAEDAVNDITQWSPKSDRVTLATGVLNLIRALGGYTSVQPTSVQMLFNNDQYDEEQYLDRVSGSSGNASMTFGWYNAFKLVALYCLGFIDDAAELGFSVFDTRQYHPNHRHVRFSLCYHSLAMIDCIRRNAVSEERKEKYLSQVDKNQTFIRKWLKPSPVNNEMWVALVEAELASLGNSLDALKLYDKAVIQASSNHWVLEEGWALYLQGTHLIRCGVPNLGSELQQRGISKQGQWGAKGIVNYLTSLIGSKEEESRQTNIFSSDVAIQTENIVIGAEIRPIYAEADEGNSQEDRNNEAASQLSSSDLSAILRWSSDISSDMNLFSALRRLTEISASVAGAQGACIVMARGREYALATSMSPPAPCIVHENFKPIRTIADPLQRSIIQHCLNLKSPVVLDDTLDSQFAFEAQSSSYRAVMCLPILSNRGQTFGAIYLASRFSFLRSTVAILTLLLQQASISISNAQLFRSVQAGTRENLKMISSQRAALDEARRSREDALKAAKIKSNFLASMSHELRTPFSSFYGLLDILSDTQLNPGQQEIVATAKVSCELLLKIIDSILDYSKLEASALKLEYAPFSMESLIADCMELLLPMAAKKLDLSFTIDPDVPLYVEADYARIRQVLMNLIGNAVKFTSSGYVRVYCATDRERLAREGEVHIKFIIQDSGIGISQSDKDQLFMPFQQADNSSTRRFGGTGLGLSISRQLVKLMGGEIGVDSKIGEGSTFWLSIPVKVHTSDDSERARLEIEGLRASIIKSMTRPHAILISPSDATLLWLSNILTGFSLTCLKSIEEVDSSIQNCVAEQKKIDFVLLDDQSELSVQSVVDMLSAVHVSPTSNVKTIHLFTPTSEFLSSYRTEDSDQSGLVRMTKPVRTLRLLQTLATLKNVNVGTTGTSTGSAVPPLSKDTHETKETALRTLYGNVLIAEDNPVAQKLLKQQLERHQLVVTTTSNGIEAIQEWEAHEPTYFSLALFDHHMPICDGIEACKRIRLMENKRKVTQMLPIVALSADCQESTKQLCLSAGMSSFFSKPLKRNDLQSLLSMFGSGPSPSSS